LREQDLKEIRFNRKMCIKCETEKIKREAQWTDRKAAADTAGGSTAAVLTAGATLINFERLPSGAKLPTCCCYLLFFFYNEKFVKNTRRFAVNKRRRRRKYTKRNEK
jgi:hypothetical protein